MPITFLVCVVRSYLKKYQVINLRLIVYPIFIDEQFQCSEFVKIIFNSTIIIFSFHSQLFNIKCLNEMKFKLTFMILYGLSSRRHTSPIAQSATDFRLTLSMLLFQGFPVDFFPIVLII